MTSTGVHSHEPSPRRASGWLSPFLRAGVCGLALTAGVLGTSSSAQAGHVDPTKPRVERVKDVDGSVWEVLIVPRPLYHAAPRPCPPVFESVPSPEAPVVPPAPAKQPKTETQTPKPKAGKPAPKPKAGKPAPKPKADKAANPSKANDAAPSPPPPPQKRSPKEEQAGHLPQPTEWISLDDKKKEASKPKKKEAAPKKKEAAPMPDTDDLGIEIVPRFSYHPAGPAAACCPAEPHHMHINPGDYWRVYRSIPFLRSEYIANPSYRHEATMEILFGQLRPTIVHKHPGQPRPHHTLFPFENDFVRPGSYYSLGAGYGPGPLPFAAPGAYGLGYNYYGSHLSAVPWGFTIPYDLTPGY